MVRKLAAALLGVGVLVPGLVQALGLGGIKLNSALSEPLDAEIELVQVRELTSDEIKPNLASNADFDAHNVEKFHFLTEMKFDVVVNQTGRSFIKVTSRKPMKEPFINFLVEVHWPEGRLLREYTMLLDPPVYRAQVAPDIRRSVVTAPKTQPRPVAASTPRPTPSPTGGAPASSAPSPRSTPASAAPAASAADGTYGPTGPSDNLWAIAEQMRPSNRVNVHQTMLAIQQLNPHAFLNGNINLLKRGQVLRGPSEEDAAAISSQEAIRMVAEQNRAWREKTTTPQTAQAAPVDTTGKGAGTVPSRVENEDGKLTLVAPAKTESVSAETGQGGDAATSGGVLRDKLALAEETTDKFKLENEDLKLKLADLQDQTSTTSQVLKLKDDQIAALQAKMAELQAQLEQVKQGGGVAPATTPSAATPAEPVADASTTPPSTEVAPVETPVTTETPVAEKEPPMAVEPPSDAPPADVDYNYDANKPPEAEKTPKVEPVGGGVVSDIQKPQLVTPEVPKPVEAPVAAPSLAQEILNNWFYLLGIAGLGAVGLAGYSLSRRKKESAGEFDDALVKDFALPKQAAAPLEDIAEPAAVPSPIAAAIPEAKKDETVAQTADVVGEADIYIAYGRFNQAVELLEKALAKEPQRDDVRLKLLEVAVESKNTDLFDHHAAVITQRGDSGSVSKLEALRARLPSVIAPAATMVGGATPEVSDELDESLDALDFDTSSLDFSKPTQTPVSTEPVGGLDFNLDFSLSDTPVPVKAEAAKPMPPAMMDNALDFDLEMDLEKEFEGTAATAKPAAPSLMAEVIEDEDVPALEFDGDITLEAPALASADDLDAGIDEGIELELADDESPVAALDDDAPLEFELVDDLDSTSHPDALLAEDDVRHAMDFEKEETIDSSSAALLADELDFEEPALELTESSGGFDLDETIEAPAPTRQVMSFDETIEAPAQVRQTPVAPSFTPAPMGKMDAGEEDLNFITDGDESSTKLDLARAYIDMGDREGAKDILDEVLLEGNADQQREAKDLLARLE